MQEEREQIEESIPPSQVPDAESKSGNNERLIISHIENINFKSYAGKRVLGPFHKVSYFLVFTSFVLVLY